MRSKLLLIILVGLVSHNLYGQVLNEQDSSDAHVLRLTSSILTSYGEDAPYWLVSNNSGRLSATDGWGALITAEVFKKPQAKYIDYFYGLESQLIANTTSRANLIQSYVGMRVGSVNLHLGMKEEMPGLNDSTLSIGNLVYGNNARPIPKIVFQTNDWVKSPILGEVLSFKMYVAHGWFEKNRYQSGAMLHQKSFYLRASALKQRFQTTVGIHHSAQWAGQNLAEETAQPIGIGNFARIFLGLSGGVDAQQTDQLNALGNHLGSYDLSAAYDFGKFTIRNYWQFIWEDKSGLTPFNWRDGLIGLSIKTKKRKGLITNFNAELIRTSSQDAIKFDEGVRIFEPDNFYNNSVYRSGWTHQQRIIGSPLFLILNPESTSNNKIKNVLNAINIGVGGHVNDIQYRINYLSSKNHGTLSERISPGLTLKLLAFDLAYSKGPHQFGLKGSVEWGNYPGRNAGILMSYSRSISLSN